MGFPNFSRDGDSTAALLMLSKLFHGKNIPENPTRGRCLEKGLFPQCFPFFFPGCSSLGIHGNLGMLVKPLSEGILWE